MKVSVILPPAVQPDLSNEELKTRWQKLWKVPGVDEIVFSVLPLEAGVEEVSDAIGDAEAVLGVWITKALMSDAFFQKHPHLVYMATLAHTYEPIDEDLLAKYDVTVSATAYGAHTIAEYTFALLMEVCHHIGTESRRIRETDWTDDANAYAFSKVLTPQWELYGRTIGIVGLGKVGYETARIASGFGMHVLGYSRHLKTDRAYDFLEQTESLVELLLRSDVVSLHLPGNAETCHIIDEKAFDMMKPGAILINTARGSLVDEKALYEALKNRKIAAAGLDVLEEEPPVHGCELLKLDNCIVTGHIGWLTKEARLRAVDLAIAHFSEYLKGDGYARIQKKVSSH